MLVIEHAQQLGAATVQPTIQRTLQGMYFTKAGHAFPHRYRRGPDEMLKLIGRALLPDLPAHSGELNLFVNRICHGGELWNQYAGGYPDSSSGFIYSLPPLELSQYITQLIMNAPMSVPV